VEVVWKKNIGKEKDIPFLKIEIANIFHVIHGKKAKISIACFVIARCMLWEKSAEAILRLQMMESRIALVVCCLTDEKITNML